MTGTSNEIEMTTIAFLHNGHSYAYAFDDPFHNDKAGGSLYDATGKKVASYLAAYYIDEYRYLYHTASGEVMLRQHENEPLECPIWAALAGQYEAHES